MPATPVNDAGFREALLRWQATPRGRRILNHEMRELRGVLPDIFGRTLLQIGEWGVGHPLLASAEVLHRAVLAAGPAAHVHAVTNLTQLPLPSRCVDAVLLPHTLEFTHDPHAVLREVARVLNDRGRLLVLGFNPWCAVGFPERRGLRRRLGRSYARSYGVGRLSDWLSLLDMEVSTVIRYGGPLPRTRHGERQASALRSLAAPLRPAYLLVAQKRVIPMTRMRLPQRAQVRPLLGRAVSLPGARSEPT